jgi:hypothetical protein
LAATEALWPDVRVTFGWVHRVAHLLTNREGRPGPEVKRRLGGLLGAISHHRDRAGALKPAVAHFLKVTRSYWPGLFHCYEVPDLPKTNNDLEHVFGASRYHERRCTGRKVASPALVLRGPVRVLAALATRERSFAGEELAPGERQRWKTLREELEARRRQRVSRCRFRRDPQAYLASLEGKLLKRALPP